MAHRRVSTLSGQRVQSPKPDRSKPARAARDERILTGAHVPGELDWYTTQRIPVAVLTLPEFPQAPSSHVLEQGVTRSGSGCLLMLTARTPWKWERPVPAGWEGRERGLQKVRGRVARLADGNGKPMFRRGMFQVRSLAGCAEDCGDSGPRQVTIPPRCSTWGEGKEPLSVAPFPASRLHCLWLLADRHAESASRSARDGNWGADPGHALLFIEADDSEGLVR